jgi:anti-sigma factor RsiW
MKHNIDPQRIDAFIDGELDLESQLEIERQMRIDGDLRERVEGARQLQAAVREQADYHEIPAALRERLDALAAPTAPKVAAKAALAASSRGAAALVERWFGWRPAAASLALVGIGALTMNLATMQTSQNDRLLDEVVSSHVRSTLGQHLVDVASSDHHTVKPWLSSKLDFSPPVNELHLPDCEFLGGRVDYLDGRPVAALVYRKGRHIVNAFVWPSTAKDSKADFATERGFQTARWSQGAMTHWVVSDVNREEFNAIVRAIQSAESAK